MSMVDHENNKHIIANRKNAHIIHFFPHWLTEINALNNCLLDILVIILRQIHVFLDGNTL